MESLQYVSIVTTVVVVILYAAATSDAEPTGPGVCTVLDVHLKPISIKEFRIQPINVSYFCLQSFKLKCYLQTEKIAPVYIDKIINIYKLVTKCCKGYTLSESGLHCNPVCENPCKWGKCILPNVCLCDKYYEGPTCEDHSVCPLGKFGLDCKETCQCQHNSSCNPFNGSCDCQAGFTGKYCEARCRPGFYGFGCRKKCSCALGVTCNPENGTCSLPKPIVKTVCPPGFYGPNCQNRCRCQNDGKCNSENGNCICQPGFIGSECESQCPPGYYGFNCLGKCDCPDGAPCNPLNGYCMSEPGNAINDSKSACPQGLFGANCSSVCKCENGAKCRRSDGVCLCPSGFFGPTCSKVCPPNLYGEMCTKVCICNTAQCDPIRGCIFNPDESNDSYAEFIQSKGKIKSRSGISNTLVVLILLCMSALLITYKCYIYNTLKKSNEANENNSKLQRPIDLQVNSGISVISSGKYLKSNMIDMKNMEMSCATESYHNDVSFNQDHYGYDTAENFYFEIDDGKTCDNTENVYDHLDFLRPAKSWKPHYQKPLVMQEPKISSCRNCNSSRSQSQNTNQ